MHQLALSNGLHRENTGTSRENIWLQLFEMIIPKKFVIEYSIFIIDSQPNVSREVDLAIIDNMYTPYIFQYGKLKFVPIEAVAAVIECKSSDSGLRKQEKGSILKRWCESIDNLKTSDRSIARMASGIMVNGILNDKYSTQTSTRPIRIFCGYKTKGDKEDIRALFDFVLIADGENEQKKINVLFDEEKNLEDWYEQLNHHKNETKKSIQTERKIGWEGRKLGDFKGKSEGKEISLLSFNFQFNQLLMLINNPILFPHLVNVDMFNQ